MVDQSTGTFADPERVHPIDHAGRFFAVRGPLNVPRPVQGQPVILHRDVPAGDCAGRCRQRRDRAGPAGHDRRAKHERADWRALAARHGRDADGLRYVVRDGDPGGDGGCRGPARGGARRVDGAGRPCTRFVGTPEQFAAHLAEWHAAGACDGFDILPAVLPIDLDLLVDAVVPLLRQRGPGARGLRLVTTLRGHLGSAARAQSRFAAGGRRSWTWQSGGCISASSPIPAGTISRDGGMAPSSRADPGLRLLPPHRPGGRARQVRPGVRGRHAGGAREGRPRHRPGRAEQHRIRSRSSRPSPAPPNGSAWWRRFPPPTTSLSPSPSASPRSTI